MIVTQINNLEVNELQELIENSVKKVLEQNASKKEPETEFITRFEVAKMLQISLVTLTEWIKQGKVPALRIGTRVRFKKADVLNSLKEIQTLKYGRAL
jgi:excisionase family DNA binding protein